MANINKWNERRWEDIMIARKKAGIKNTEKRLINFEDVFPTKVSKQEVQQNEKQTSDSRKHQAKK